ncbi:MetQ/NlpA family ABC transporter substrate-binding protein [Apilactobacillus kunkeei]|uniref:MetQ/NlpA family ABC transporter substrate-binding protein n=1 Tax=Apilactobacillus kunkeei TaxID=148814 RepID=UPI0006B25AA4|nr:MetQ/NlpA family ABC transporter substrate-binding protein [Apilactobacillus kunkeei]KOY70196.1 Lipoprotein (Precursor) [Apilactobacillus kunkeei]CAI2660373.1 Methionine-binding lipoprotein MetQ [Apilactobacillus kunkeei]
MKKLLSFGGIVVLFIVLLLLGPGNYKAKNTIRIGASNIPHAQILRHIEPDLRKKGIKLDIVTFQDYVLPNRALAGKQLDANYFQTPAFLDQWNKEYDGHLVNVGAVHLEPIGIYSKKYKKLSDLKNGAHILVSSNAPDYGRILQLFQQNGLIKIKKGVNITQANFSDIAYNPKHLVFQTGYEPKIMPLIYNNGEGDAVAINSNYAVQGGLQPDKQSIALQKPEKNSPYFNIVAVRNGDQNRKDIKELVKVLQSKSTQEWIKKHYKGSVLPAKNY